MAKVQFVMRWATAFLLSFLAMNDLAVAQKANSDGVELETEIFSFLYSNKPKIEATNWKKQAAKRLYTVDEDGVSIPIEAGMLEGQAGLRCARLNNYGCVQNRKAGWPFTKALDRDNHVLVSDGSHSIAMMTRLLRRYYFDPSNPRRTPKEIMCKYAPPNDCIGTGERNSDGSCKFGFNQCEKYAEHVARAMFITPDQDSKIFDSKGVPRKELVHMIRYVTNMEISDPARNLKLFARTSAIKKGIQLERRIPPP